MHKLLRLLLVSLPLLVVSACHKEESPAEKAGTAIDNIAQELKDAVAPPGPLEKAGRAVDKALN